MGPCGHSNKSLGPPLIRPRIFNSRVSASNRQDKPRGRLLMRSARNIPRSKASPSTLRCSTLKRHWHRSKSYLAGHSFKHDIIASPKVAVSPCPTFSMLHAPIVTKHPGRSLYRRSMTVNTHFLISRIDMDSSLCSWARCRDTSTRTEYA